MKLRKTLISLLTLLLMLVPYAVFAQSSDKEITYLSIGDSLAAGMLSDRSSGEGYVGKITSQLESLNYDVTVHPLGVPGYTSEDVLQLVNNSDSLPNDADIVTITAGANDLLSGLDLGKISSFDPNAITEVMEEINVIFSEVNKRSSEISESSTDIDQHVESLLTSLGPIETYPPSIQEAMNEFQANYDELNNHMVNVKNYGDEVINAYSSQDFESVGEYISLIKNELKEADTKVTNIITVIDTLLAEDMLDGELVTILQQMKNDFTGATQIIQDFSSLIDELITLIEQLTTLLQEANEIEHIFTDLATKITTVGQNIGKIIGIMQARYPNAKIYVMGYYNALPYLSPSTQEHTVPLIHGLNSAIKTAADATGVTFVPTFGKFEGNYESYLPNPQDIHPSDAGYVAIADAFIAEIAKTFTGVSDSSPIEVEINLGETIEVKPGQLIKIKGTNVHLLIPNSIEAGTKLKVTATDEAIVAKATDLKAVGSVLHFEFKAPEFLPALFSQENALDTDEELFTLTFGYEHDSDDVAIYHFDEDDEQWTEIGGEVNKETKEVSVQIDHFSNYGVFAEVEEEETPVTPEQPKEEDPGIEEDDDDEDKVVTIEDDKKEVTKTKAGTLPKTATSIYNVIIIGSVLVILGITLFVMYRRKKLVGKM